MESTLFSFTGENAFALREELRAWRQRFAEKHGAENLLVLPASGLRFRALLDEVSVAPFIARKRLVIVEGTPAFTKEEVEMLPAAIHPDCVLVIADASPDKRLGAVKALQKTATVKEFPLLKGKALLAWATQRASHAGSTLPHDAAEELLATTGEDQDALACEVEKLALYAAGRPITRRDVEALCPPSGEQEVWRLTQMIADGKRADALRYASELLARGEDPFSLWNILLWMLRTLVTVCAAVQDGERQPARIAAQYRVPFPSARNLLPLAQRLSPQTLSTLVSWAAETDRELKTGGYRATREAPEELEALIDGFILRATAMK